MLHLKNILNDGRVKDSADVRRIVAVLKLADKIRKDTDGLEF